MFKSGILVFLAFLLSASMLITTSVCFGKGEILFQEDFEADDFDENKWVPDASWSIVDGVLVISKDAGGWPVGYTARNDFTDFEFSADFKISGGACSSFLFRGQSDTDYYMAQFCQPNDNTVWWHKFAGGAYVVEQVPMESDLIPEPEVWYSVKFVAEGEDFTLYIAEQGEELELANSWQDDTYNEGSIGFWTCCNENTQYDNVLVTTVGYVQPVSPEGNLSTAWGSIKLYE